MRLLLSLMVLLSLISFGGCNTTPKPHPKVEPAPTNGINNLNMAPPVDTNGRINRF